MCLPSIVRNLGRYWFQTVILIESQQPRGDSTYWVSDVPKLAGSSFTQSADTWTLGQQSIGRSHWTVTPGIKKGRNGKIFFLSSWTSKEGRKLQYLQYRQRCELVERIWVIHLRVHRWRTCSLFHFWLLQGREIQINKNNVIDVWPCTWRVRYI